MKKRNLTAAFLACALCAVAMTGAGCAPQACYTDEAEAVAAVSTVGESPSEAAVERAPDDKAGSATAQEAKCDQTEAETVAPANSEDEIGSDPKSAAKADPQPQVKKPAQNGVATPKQEAWHEVAVANYEADPGGDEVPLVIDSVPADSEESVAKASTITINGVEIDYVDSYGTASAPGEGAGIWRGSDSTTDGSYGYFIGHDYTEFGDIANLEQGSVVSVTDCNGDSCDYEVVDSFVVPRDSYWSDISDRVTGYGESVVMQTCVDGGYLIVVAD